MSDDLEHCGACGEDDCQGECEMRCPCGGDCWDEREPARQVVDELGFARLGIL